MTEKNNSFHLEEYFKALRDSAPQREPRDTSRGRAAFLARAEQGQAADRTGWFSWIKESMPSLSAPFSRPRLTAASGLLIAVLFAIGVLGGTAYAAQNSLPEDTLYPVKTFTEDVRLKYTAQPKKKIQLLETYSLRRVEELDAISKQGQKIPSSMLERMEQHTDTMLKLSAEQEEHELSGTLIQVRNVLRAQDEALEKLTRSERVPASQALSRVQKKLDSKLVLVENGINNPASFQQNMNSPHPFQLQPTATEDKLPEKETPDAKGKPEEVGPPQDKKGQDQGQPSDQNKHPEKTGPADDPGKSGVPGPPEGKGKPDKGDPPEEKGKPDDPGPPPGKKKPDKGGPPEGKGKPPDK